MSNGVTVEVHEELRALLPGFLARRQGDLTQLAQLLAAQDFAAITLLGHNMKGVGGGYGFAQVSALGERLEQAAQHQDAQAAAGCLIEYQQYLADLHIVFV